MSHVDDDFTLWVVCRRVSRTIRAEAEREFARERLSHLRFVIKTWIYHDDLECDETRRFWAAVQLQNLRAFTEGDRAIFKAYSLIKIEGYELSDSALDALLCEGISKTRIDGPSGRMPACREFTLSPYINMVPLNGVQVDRKAETLSIGGKTFLDLCLRSAETAHKTHYD